MARGITATIQTEAGKSVVEPVFFMEFMFTSGTTRFWTGLNQIVWNSVTWFGSGNVIKISPISETARVEASGIQFQLALEDTILLPLALTEDVQGRAVNLYMGFLNSTGAVLADPVGPFEYLMNTISIDDNPDNNVITLTAESYLASLEVPRVRRYTHDDQQIEFPGDKGLEFVASIQQKEITWGRT